MHKKKKNNKKLRLFLASVVIVAIISIIYIIPSTFSRYLSSESLSATLNITKPIFEITLDNQGADVVQGTDYIYEKYSIGFYLNSSATTQMTTSSNGITIPEKDGYTFQGYYTQTNGGGTQYIDENGKLTSSANSSNFTADDTLYAYYIENSKLLYDVLKRAANEGTYARTYTGSHQDSMDSSKSTETIYYWYGSNSTNGTAILNKNNVVFANQCWQMIRTTDTGGVRLLYNGEPTITVENGEINYDCGSSRPGHIGGIKTTQSLSGSYYYGDGYTTAVSGNTTTYTLTNATQVTINASNAATEIPTIVSNNPYTCKSTSSTGTCTTLYKVDSQSSGVNAYVYDSTYRDAIGVSRYNSNYNSVGDVGYMYNSRYAVNSISFSQSLSLYTKIILNSSNLTTYGNFYFGDGYTMSGNNHVLTNAVKGNTITDYPSSWVGMYMCQSNSSSKCSTIYYIGAIDTSGTNPIIYRATISSGREYNNSAYKYLFGDSITDNGDGTFEISGNIQEVVQKDWATEYSTKVNKYVCMPGYYTYDSVNDKYICSDNGSQKVGALRYVTATTISNIIASSIYKYGFGIASSGSNYELTSNSGEDGTLQYIYNWPNTANSSCFTNPGDSISNCGYKTLSKSHYTCYNLTGVCSTYYYINYISKTDAYSAQITGGKYVSTDLTDTNNILYEMLYKGNVNTTNSTIKGNVDLWYQNTLLTNFDSYIDDTIYCNNRTITNFGGWNPNGGTTDSNYLLQFREYSVSTDLSCPNITDKFSVSNNSARLSYKVGLMSSPELNLLNHANARTSANYYWLASPYFFSRNTATGRGVSANGNWSSNSVSGAAGGVRPAVSLISGLEYSKGDGSTTNPYVVDLSSVSP